MHRHPTSFYTLLLFQLSLLLFSNCDSPTDMSQEYEPLSSADPLSVNYRVRQQKYEQGNLVHNASFELGKVKQVDSLTQSIVIEGWDIVGKNIRWLKILSDSVTEYNPYIHTGNRAIKIVKENASETDEIGNGVISDYIRVIPGNYSLSMYLNLIDIENPKSRLGTGIYDAVDIRIIYYDKNKISISGKQYSPYHKNYFDNSFKGESLSKFSGIDSTGWIHIQGRSHLFPVPDGDIQDNAKFIRIFIGLKGNGTLYIDDINYEYTRWNFTQLERLEPFFDTTFSLCQLIIPQPRSVQVLGSIIYYRPYYKDIFPVILIPENSDKTTRHAARILENHLKQTISELTNIEIDAIPDLITSKVSDQILQSTVTFSIGKTYLFKQKSGLIPIEEIANEEQGFLVHTTNDDLSVIYLVGNTPVSNYYAVQAAMQLFDNRRLLFHNANIVDYPENQVRSLLLSDLNEYSVEFLTMTKATRYNQVYLAALTTNIEKKIKRINEQGTYSIRLYANFQSATNNTFLSLQRLSELIAKNKSLVDGYALFSEPIDEEHIQNNNELPDIPIEKELRKLASLGLPFEIQPGEYQAGIFCSDLMEGIHRNTDAYNNFTYLWAGNGRSTWKLDMADYLYNTSIAPGRTAFMDLTLYPRDRVSNYFMYDSLWPYKLPKASLFESYDNEVVREIYNRVDKSILAFRAETIFDDIRLQTASDYFWNPDMYDPDLSLYRALITTFGVKLTQDLLYFNDYYFKAHSELILANIPKNYQKHIRRADANMEQLKIIQSRIETQDQIFKNKELIDIIAFLIEDVESMREKLKKASVNVEE